MGKKKDSKQSRVKTGLRKKDKTNDVQVVGEIPEDYGAVIDIVKEFWLTLSKEQQLQFLTVSIQELQQQAKTIQETTIKELDKLQKEQVVDVEFQPDTCERALEQGLKRMRQGRTCKEWIWTRNNVNYTSAQEFRQYIVDNHITEDLRESLPADSATESPAEKNLRKRMSEVGRKVQVLGGWTQEYQFSGSGGGQKGSGSKRARKWAVKEPKALYEKHIEVLLYMLNSLEKEHGFLQEFVFVPVQSFMREALGTAHFDVIDFSSDDLHRLHQEDVYSIIEWVIEKIEMLSSKWKLDPEEDLEEGDQEENVAEIDLFKLTEDQQCLVVEPKWFDHLADRVLGTDGTPKKRTDECPQKQGLVLDWIYGMIVSTAERAREACRHALGQRVPCFEHALNLFSRALQIQCVYTQVEQVLQSVVGEMKDCGQDAGSVLQSNCLAHKARALCSLMEAWTFNKQFKQYRPSKEFDHMQLLSHVMKTVHNPEHEMESCSSVLLEDFPSGKQRQTELISKVFGSKFCTQLNKIIGAYDSKKVMDHLGLMLCFEWASQHLHDTPLMHDLPLLSQTDIQKELECVTQRLNQLSQKIIEGTAALHHLEMNLINLACEDPGALISMHLALPIIQKKLYFAARAHAEERANAVCQDLICSIQQEEMRKEAKRQSKKKKKKPRVQEEIEEKEEVDISILENGGKEVEKTDSAEIDDSFTLECDNQLQRIDVDQNDSDSCFVQPEFDTFEQENKGGLGSNPNESCEIADEEFDGVVSRQRKCKLKVDVYYNCDVSLNNRFQAIQNDSSTPKQNEDANTPKFDSNQNIDQNFTRQSQDKTSADEEFQQTQHVPQHEKSTDIVPNSDKIDSNQDADLTVAKNSPDTDNYIDETIFVLDSSSHSSKTGTFNECQLEQNLHLQQEDEISEENSFDDAETCAYPESEEGCLSCSGPFKPSTKPTRQTNEFSVFSHENQIVSSSKCSVTQEKIDDDNHSQLCYSANYSVAQDQQADFDANSLSQLQDKVLSPHVQSLITTPTPTVRDAVSDFNGSEDSPIYGIEQQKLKNQINYEEFHPLLAGLLLQNQQMSNARMSPESGYSRTQLEELPSFDIWDTPIDCLNDSITTQTYSNTFPRGFDGGRLDGVLPTDVLVCPITKSFFSDPVVAADGNTYERKAIEIWMSYFTHSPVTGDKLAHKMLIPNHLVKGMIEGIRQGQQAVQNIIG